MKTPTKIGRHQTPTAEFRFKSTECGNVPSLHLAMEAVGLRPAGPQTGSGASLSAGDATDLSMSPSCSGAFSMSPPTTRKILRDRRRPPQQSSPPGGGHLWMAINCGLKSPTASRKVDSEGTEAVSMRDLRAIFLRHPALISVRATPSLR